MLVRSSGLTERICGHGIGHPDPDSLSWLDRDRPGHVLAVHGCDGCCLPPLITLEVPAPCEWITSNQRLHPMKRHRLTERWRATARLVAFAAKVPPAVTVLGEGRVHVLATVHRVHRRGRWDPANWYPTAKAVVDGLVDAGVLTDDSARHITGPDMRAGDPTDPATLTLTLTKETTA